MMKAAHSTGIASAVALSRPKNLPPRGRRYLRDSPRREESKIWTRMLQSCTLHKYYVFCEYCLVMTSGGELFIVDNSESEWKGLRYIEEWTEIASSFDI